MGYAFLRQREDLNEATGVLAAYVPQTALYSRRMMNTTHFEHNSPLLATSAPSLAHMGQLGQLEG